MSHEERNNIVAILVNLATNAYVITRLRSLWSTGAFDGPDALMIWARAILWVVPIAIGGTIVLTILANILFAIATLDENPDFTVDERDRMFQLRGMAVTMVVASFGFLGCLVALAVGWEALIVFTLLYVAFSAGDLIGNLVKLVSYRIGT